MTLAHILFWFRLPSYYSLPHHGGCLPAPSLSYLFSSDYQLVPVSSCRRRVAPDPHFNHHAAISYGGTIRTVSRCPALQCRVLPRPMSPPADPQLFISLFFVLYLDYITLHTMDHWTTPTWLGDSLRSSVERRILKTQPGLIEVGLCKLLNLGRSAMTRGVLVRLRHWDYKN